MEILKAFFSQGWVGVLMGILAGLLIALYFYRASRIGPRPSYQLKALRLLAKDERALPEEVEILFKGVSVPRLTKTHLIFWNSGRAMLDGKQIVDADPLRLEFNKDAQVLRARVVSATRKTNEFEVKINDKSPNEVVCHFDYLDVGDGAVIELLHTDEGPYPKVQGTIRGVPKGILNWGPVRSSGRVARQRRIAMFAMIIVGVAIIVLGIIAPDLRKPSASAEPFSVWVPVILGLVYMSFPLYALWTTRRRFSKSLTIEDIEQ
jgi:hypothetical protein